MRAYRGNPHFLIDISTSDFYTEAQFKIICVQHRVTHIIFARSIVISILNFISFIKCYVRFKHFFLLIIDNTALYNIKDSII